MPDLSLAAAQTIVATALETARGHDLKPLAVVVYDARGALKALGAEDGTSLRRAEVAMGKANGCLALGLGGRAIHKRAEEQAYFAAAVSHLVGPADATGGQERRPADEAVAPMRAEHRLRRRSAR